MIDAPGQEMLLTRKDAGGKLEEDPATELPMSTRPLLLVLVLLLCAPMVVFADAAPVLPAPGGNAMLLTPHGWIRLVEETIVIRLEAGAAEVEVRYLFHCDGPADEVVMGFPNRFMPTSIRPLEDFRVFEGERELEVVRAPLPYREDMPNEPGWETEWLECFRVSFAAGEEKEIINRYSQPYGTGYRSSVQGFTYILHTGALWAGTIERLHVIVENPSGGAVNPLGRPAYSIYRGEIVEDRYPGFFGSLGSIDPTARRGPTGGRGVADPIAPKPAEYVDEGDRVTVIYEDIDPLFDIQFIVPPHLRHRVRASSVLPPGRTADYEPENVTDGDPATSWVEGVDGPGIGESIELSVAPLGSPGAGVYGVRGLEIINGYAANDAFFASNNRVRRIRVSFRSYRSGSRFLRYLAVENSFEFELEDTMAPQIVELPQVVPAGDVEVEILDVYPGSRWDDTCIAELSVITAPPTTEDLYAIEFVAPPPR